MRRNARRSVSAIVFIVTSLITAAGFAQVTGGTDRNTSQMAAVQKECAIAKNPNNKLQLFALCNHDTAGLFATRTDDGGLTWTYPDADKTIADGDAGQGPQAWSDPNLAWDTFGNLFITYIDHSKTNVVTILSTDGGLTFNNLASWGPASVDQPTIVVANTTAPGVPVQVRVVWNEAGQMVTRGAAVTGLGVANVGAFTAQQTIPGTANCSFGDVIIASDGRVVQVCESTDTGEGPSTIKVSVDADGLGAGNFGAISTATTTNVGPLDRIPAQMFRTVDAEAGLAYDRNPTSPHAGRLYLVYTEENGDESNDTDIRVRFSDDNGGIWSASTKVNDDAGTRSQFFPRISANPLSGNIAICWSDCRNSAANTGVQEFCTIATPAGFPAFISANAQIGDGTSTSPGTGGEYGDYAGLDYFQGVAHPIWADNSNSTGDNPGGAGTTMDAYSDRVSGGAAANEGDPHITTVDGVRYDFQSAGEFVALRDPDGLEIQTRQTPVATTFTPGADPHDGLAMCVSLNSAVAARVAGHRVTYEPNVSGVPDPSGMQLRVDGTLRTLTTSGITLAPGARVAKTAVGDGIEIDFPNGTLLIAVPLFWSSQGKWYLNVDVYRTPATDGIMGAIAPGSWLPALPNGASLGAMPGSMHQRYVDLYQRFADAWRITDKSSLFDYRTGTSTGTFTFREWPSEKPPCVLPNEKPATPLDLATSRRLCADVTGKAHDDCVFDVHVTGEPGFAKLYLLTQRIRLGATSTVVSVRRDGDIVAFNATVARRVPGGRGTPSGLVQFFVDDRKSGDAVKLNAAGNAVFRTNLKGEHRIAARYTPADGTSFLASSSIDERIGN
jgi:hypothetical protein